MSIELVPDIAKYPHIHASQKEKRLVVFVGAGISAIWGCKRWKEMGTALIETCYEKGKINFLSKENILYKNQSSPRKLITIGKNILGGEYIDVLKETLQCSPERRDKFPSLFSNLLGWDAIYITTNIDNYLSSLFEKEKIHFEPNTFSTSLLEPRHIVHLHGIISNPDSLVLSVDEYIERYQHERFRNFLEKAFFDEQYCFLFIGYGMGEMEIIDFIIEKYSKGHKKLNYINHFYILLPFLYNDEKLLEYEELYFNQINMSVIPYSINEKGYDQIDKIIKTWQEEFAGRPLEDEFYKNIQFIERNL